MTRRVVIVGGGAAGALVALHLLRDTTNITEVTVVEPRERLAEGVAYSTADAAHLLNVPAGGMSAYDDDPAHFVRWMRCDANDFVARHRYADYLRDELQRAAVARPQMRFVHLHESVEHIVAARRGEIRLLTARTAASDTQALSADAVVLALGNAPPTRPAWCSEVEPARLIADPWAPGALDKIGDGERVLCVGTGLTFVDVALTLSRRGASVTGTSRHGLLPAVHAGHVPNAHAPAQDAPAPVVPAHFDSPVAVSRWLRAQPDWRAAFAALRPHTQRIWRGFSSAQQSQFLRHARRHWDVHRHRMSQTVADELHDRLRDGRVRVVRDDARALATTRDFDRVVLCTGPDDTALLQQAPLAQLVADGVVQPGPHGMGIDTDPDTGQVCDASQRLVGGLFAIGTLRRGTLWESTAVPELRTQARRLAAVLDA